MTARIRAWALTFGLLAAVPFLTAVAGAETGFLDRSITVDGAARHYQVYVPFGWTKRQSWPVVLFLHGAGERGSDGLKQTQVGLGAALRLNAQRFPAVVVFPQCPDGKVWTDPGMAEQAMAIFEQAVKKFHGDRKRLYLTGISIGGYGSWHVAAMYPGVFAAVSPVSAGVGALTTPIAIPAVLAAKHGLDVYATLAQAIGDTPVWLFHGAQDPLIPVADARRMAALLTAAHPNDHYTEYPSAGHDAWDQAYADADWARWLFSQRLP